MTAGGAPALDPATTAALVGIVRSTAWLCDLLHIVRDVGPPAAFVAAGAVRDTVWDVLTGRRSSGPHADVDVVYWDDAEPEHASRLHESRLRAARSSIDPAQSGADVFWKRVADKRWLQRWPELKLVHPPSE